jgi:hypothetical protein
MATLLFTVDEAMHVLRANGRLPENIRDVRADGDGLLLTVRGGIAVRVSSPSFADGILYLAFNSKNWLFKFADSMGRIDAMIDEALRDLPFVRRQGKSLRIDLDRALQDHIQGMRVQHVGLGAGLLRVDLEATGPFNQRRKTAAPAH